MKDIKITENIHQNDKDFMMIVYKDGVREVYEITNKLNVSTPENVVKYGDFVGRDYNGDHPDPPPLIPSDVSPNICPTCKIMDKKIQEIQRREEELEKREEELEKNWNEIRKKSKSQ